MQKMVVKCSCCGCVLYEDGEIYEGYKIEPEDGIYCDVCADEYWESERNARTERIVDWESIAKNKSF